MTRQIQATVCYSLINGGSYALCADDNLTYEPLVLEEPFKQDGLRVERGIVVEILEIRVARNKEVLILPVLKATG